MRQTTTTRTTTRYRVQTFGPRLARVIRHYTLTPPNMSGISKMQAVEVECRGEHAGELAQLCLEYLQGKMEEVIYG